MVKSLSDLKGKREFFNFDAISRHLKCSICHDVFQDPMRIKCGHTFCYICIQNWAVVSKKCPLCKQSLKNRKVERDLIAFNLIDDLTAKCLHPNCNWEGLYSMLKKHQRRCRLRKPKESIDQRAAIHSIDESQSAQVVEVMHIDNSEPSSSSPSSEEVLPSQSSSSSSKSNHSGNPSTVIRRA